MRVVTRRVATSENAFYALGCRRGQIDEYQLPTRPTKTTDSRARKLMLQYGTGSVELDAIPPATLRGLVRNCIERHMDPGRLRTLQLAECQERDLLRRVWGGAA